MDWPRICICAHRGGVLKFAQVVFRTAAVLGLIQVIPMFFLEGMIASSNPPPLNHPEFYYCLLSVVVAFQLVYGCIGLDPNRYRPFMLVAMAGKLSVVLTVAALFCLRGIGGNMLAAGFMDGFWLIMFAVAYKKTAKA